MTEFNRHTRLPLERAIEFVENVLEPDQTVLLSELKTRIQSEAPEAATHLDHTLQVMISNGYLRRRSLGPDRLAYEKTERWVNRDETLILLRAPRYKYRHRPRARGKRVYPVAGTVAQASEVIRSLPAQSDLFSGAV